MKNADMPVAPATVYDRQEGEMVEGHGLTKRELMAMHMMQGLISAWGQHDVTCFEQLANDAVLAADELLSELDRTSK